MIVIGLSLALGCAGPGVETGDPAAPAPSLAADLQPIFDRNCTGTCHSGEAPASGLVLSPGAAYANLVGVASVQVPSLVRVAPGDPDASYLVAKLEDTHVAVGGSGTRMPPYLRLADNELLLFRDWILAGAAE